MSSVLQAFEMEFFKGGACLRDKETGAKWGPLENLPLPKLQLKGQTPGQGSLHADFVGSVSFLWQDKERERWAQAKLQTSHQAAAAEESKVADEPPYTAAEKAWLKTHYGGEFHFLRLHALSIYEEDERAEDRAIVRSLISDEDDEKGKNDSKDGSRSKDEDDNRDDEEEEGSDTNSFLHDLETDPTSHVADYHFSEVELDWIKQHWRHSGNFLLSYGLKPYKDEDCEEGKQVIKALMEDSNKLADQSSTSHGRLL